MCIGVRVEEWVGRRVRELSEALLWLPVSLTNQCLKSVGGR